MRALRPHHRADRRAGPRGSLSAPHFVGPAVHFPWLQASSLPWQGSMRHETIVIAQVGSGAPSGSPRHAQLPHMLEKRRQSVADVHSVPPSEVEASVP